MYLKDKPFTVRFATWLSHLAFILFIGLMIASAFGAVQLGHVFFPSVGAVLATLAYRMIQESRQRKVEMVEAIQRAREAELAQRMKSPATAGGRVQVDVDLDHLRRVLDRTTGTRQTSPENLKKRAGVEPTQPWGEDDTPRRRRTDKPVETSASTDPLPITNPAHPLHTQTYGSTFGNTNADSYPAKEAVSHEVHRAPCSPSPSHYDSSPSYSPSYDSSPSYSCSSDSGSSSSSDSGCGGGGGCD